jgi:arylformamidase
MIYDLTRPLKNGMEYIPGDPVPSFTTHFHDPYRITEINMGSHTGTHIDAPAHYLKHGTTIEELSLETLVGTCFILELENGPIYETQLHSFENEIISSSRLLIRAGKHAGLMPCAAMWLASRCRCLGIDNLSISYEGYDTEVHTILMQAGVVIMEGLDFRTPLHGEYTLIVLPLLLSEADGAPARVVVCDRDYFMRF